MTARFCLQVGKLDGSHILSFGTAGSLAHQTAEHIRDVWQTSGPDAFFTVIADDGERVDVHVRDVKDVTVWELAS